MSKLAQMIDATLTGNVRASQTPDFKYASADLKTQVVQGFGAERQIRLMVKLEKDAYIDDNLSAASNADQWSETLHFMKQAMIEEVYGEFRPLIIEARSAVYERDFDRLRGLLAELEYRMFTEGL